MCYLRDALAETSLHWTRHGPTFQESLQGHFPPHPRPLLQRYLGNRLADAQSRPKQAARLHLTNQQQDVPGLHREAEHVGQCRLNFPGDSQKFVARSSAADSNNKLAADPNSYAIQRHQQFDKLPAE